MGDDDVAIGEEPAAVASVKQHDPAAGRLNVKGRPALFEDAPAPRRDSSAVLSSRSSGR